MDPIAEAIKMFDVGNILLAGAAVISLVIVYVGIDKVKELIWGESYEEEYYLEEGRLYRRTDYGEGDEYVEIYTGEDSWVGADDYWRYKSDEDD